MKHGGSAAMYVARVMWTDKGGMNSASGENWRKPSPSTILTEASFNGYGKEKTLNVNITCRQ